MDNQFNPKKLYKQAADRKDGSGVNRKPGISIPEGFISKGSIKLFAYEITKRKL